jgi:hypothetical protein
MVSGFGLRDASRLFSGRVQVFRAFVHKNRLHFTFDHLCVIFLQEDTLYACQDVYVYVRYEVSTNVRA